MISKYTLEKFDGGIYILLLFTSTCTLKMHERERIRVRVVVCCCFGHVYNGREVWMFDKMKKRNDTYLTTYVLIFYNNRDTETS